MVEQAPVFRPNKKEFQDPLAYIASIRPQAQRAGICKIIPPPDWRPKLTFNDSNLQFRARIQQIDMLQTRKATTPAISNDFVQKLTEFLAKQTSGTSGKGKGKKRSADAKSNLFLPSGQLKLPVVDGNPLDVYGLYSAVESLGDVPGSVEGWVDVGASLLLPSCLAERKHKKQTGSSSARGVRAASALEKHFNSFLASYHQQHRGGGTPATASASGTSKRQKQAEIVIVDDDEDDINNNTKGGANSSGDVEQEEEKDEANGKGGENKNNGNGNGNGNGNEGEKEDEDDEVIVTSPRPRPTPPPPPSGNSNLCFVCLARDRGGSSHNSHQLAKCSACFQWVHTYCSRPPLVDGVPPATARWRCHQCREGFGFSVSEQEYGMSQFKAKSNKFTKQWFEAGEPSEDEVTSEYWRLITHGKSGPNEGSGDVIMEGSPGSGKRDRERKQLPTSVEVEYGSDIDTSVYGSGFPNTGVYGRSGWNLNNLPKLQGSALRPISNISGVNVPWFYVGMTFSSFCWHNEDHYCYSINYVHSGRCKEWYGVPGWSAVDFERATAKEVPHLFRERPDLLSKMITQVSPWLLAKHGVPIYTTRQQEGEFVVTFPQAYHCGFNQGFNTSEAVNFALFDWLPWGWCASERYRCKNRNPLFPIEELLVKLAMDPTLLPEHMAWLTIPLRAVREEERLLRALIFEMGTTVGVQWPQGESEDTGDGPDEASGDAQGASKKGKNKNEDQEEQDGEKQEPDDISWRGMSYRNSKTRYDQKHFNRLHVSSLDANTRVQCRICLHSLYLSAVYCTRCASGDQNQHNLPDPNHMVCLRHANELCGCPASCRRVLYRHSLHQLDMIVNSVVNTVAAHTDVSIGSDPATIRLKEILKESKEVMKRSEKGGGLPVAYGGTTNSVVEGPMPGLPSWAMPTAKRLAIDWSDAQPSVLEVPAEFTSRIQACLDQGNDYLERERVARGSDLSSTLRKLVTLDILDQILAVADGLLWPFDSLSCSIIDKLVILQMRLQPLRTVITDLKTFAEPTSRSSKLTLDAMIKLSQACQASGLDVGTTPGYRALSQSIKFATALDQRLKAVLSPNAPRRYDSTMELGQLPELVENTLTKAATERIPLPILSDLQAWMEKQFGYLKLVSVRELSGIVKKGTEWVVEFNRLLPRTTEISLSTSESAVALQPDSTTAVESPAPKGRPKSKNSTGPVAQPAAKKISTATLTKLKDRAAILAIDFTEKIIQLDKILQESELLTNEVKAALDPVAGKEAGLTVCCCDRDTEADRCFPLLRLLAERSQKSPVETKETKALHVLLKDIDGWKQQLDSALGLLEDGWSVTPEADGKGTGQLNLLLQRFKRELRAHRMMPCVYLEAICIARSFLQRPTPTSQPGLGEFQMFAGQVLDFISRLLDGPIEANDVESLKPVSDALAVIRKAVQRVIPGPPSS